MKMFNKIKLKEKYPNYKQFLMREKKFLEINELDKTYRLNINMKFNSIRGSVNHIWKNMN